MSSFLLVHPLRRALRRIFPTAGADSTPAEERVIDQTRRARLTIAANVISRALSLLVVVTSSRLALDDLGPARFGIWMTIASLLLLVTMLDLGVGNGLVAPIARAAADDDREEVARLVTRGFVVTAVIGVALGLLTVTCSALAPLDRLFPGVSAETLAEARRALICFAILISASPPLGAAGRILSGLQRGYLPHIGNAIAACVTLAVLLLLARSQDHSITAYILATFGLVQVSALAMTVILAREGMVQVGLLSRLRFSDYRPLFKTGGLFFGLQLTVTLGWGLDQTLVSVMSGPAAVASFAVAARIYMLISQPLYVLNAPLWPVYADLLHRDDRASAKRTLLRSMTGTFCLAVVAVIMVMIMSPLLWTLFTADALPLDHILLATMGIWVVVECTGNALATYLNGAHIVREQLVAMLAFIAIAIPLKLIVVAYAGVAWIPLATAACYLAAMLLFYAVVYRRKILSPLRT